MPQSESKQSFKMCIHAYRLGISAERSPMSRAHAIHAHAQPVSLGAEMKKKQVRSGCVDGIIRLPVISAQPSMPALLIGALLRARDGGRRLRSPALELSGVKSCRIFTVFGGACDANSEPTSPSKAISYPQFPGIHVRSGEAIGVPPESHRQMRIDRHFQADTEIAVEAHVGKLSRRRGAGQCVVGLPAQCAEFE